MTRTSATFPLKGFGKQKAAAMIQRAKGLGMTPQRYLKHLVEEDLAISERAKSSSFKKLLGPGETTDEAEIDRFVEEAKTRYNLVMFVVRSALCVAMLAPLPSGNGYNLAQGLVAGFAMSLST